MVLGIRPKPPRGSSGRLVRLFAPLMSSTASVDGPGRLNEVDLRHASTMLSREVLDVAGFPTWRAPVTKRL